MPSLDAIVIVALIFAVSGVVRSTLGFGDALIAVPLLAWTLGLAVARPMFLLVALALTLAIFVGSYRDVDARGLAPMLIASVVTVPLGFLAADRLPEAALRAGLGVLVSVFGGMRIRAPRFELKGRHLPAGVFAGSLTGLLGAAYNIMGPPLIMYTSLLGWPPARFRATLQACFLPPAIAILAGHLVTGTINAGVLTLAAVAVPFSLTGGYVGLLLNRRIDTERFAGIVGFALVAMGVALAYQGVRALLA